jgi:hypothetical protein
LGGERREGEGGRGSTGNDTESSCKKIRRKGGLIGLDKLGGEREDHWQ